MGAPDDYTLATNVLASAGAIIDGVQAGCAARGFDDMRPVYSFAFMRLAGDGATASELAAHLGVTKQAAGQLVKEMEAKGYVSRRPHPDDARARLVVLTDRGQACTAAAVEAAAETVDRWRALLGPERLTALRDDLTRIAPKGRIRPTW